jgi:hypothetical protein
MPQASECPSSSHTCDVSRLPAGTEYRIDVSGPSAFAIHVVDAEASTASAQPVLALSGAGYRGLMVARGAAKVAVISNDSADETPGASLTYRVPAAVGTVHVVVDAPVDGAGKSDVSSLQDGSDCKFVVTPHTGASAGLDGRPLVLRTSAGCAVTDDGAQALAPDFGAAGGAGAAGTGGANGSGSFASAGLAGSSNATAATVAVANDDPAASPSPSCALRAGSRNPAPLGLFVGGAIGLWLFERRRSITGRQGARGGVRR